MNVFDAALFTLKWAIIISVAGGIIGAIINHYWDNRGRK